MKKQRQKTLIKFITEHTVDTQEELQRMLEQHGFKVTQATVSRDIKDLGIIKATDKSGVYRYIYPERRQTPNMNEKLAAFFSGSVISVDCAMNDVVVKCHSGMASGAAAAMDGLYSEGVVGTIAGDDTVLAVTKNEEMAIKLTEKLRELIDGTADTDR